MDFYNGSRLLTMKDINGLTPEIYICTSNRTAGKTTYFGTYFVNRFLKYGEKFMLLYRYNYELDDIADKFFKDISAINFPTMSMESVRKGNGIYHELYLNNVSCGYGVSINSADQIKKNSHLFSDTTRMLFDEFQTESGKYCDREIQKLISIHTSVARGRGKQVRYVPLIMLGNDVSLINPYFYEFGLSTRIKSDSKFVKGDGVVLEHSFNEGAAKAQQESAFNRAFKQNKYVKYAAEGVYLDDNLAFIEKPEGIGKYIATVKIEGRNYAIRQFDDEGIVYCDTRADLTFPYKITASTDDHQVNYVMLKKNDFFLSTLRFYFEKGAFRFRDLKCKEAIFKLLAYLH